VVAIAGPPNAGKSTLLNRIARREAAIVSPLPGTTRDVIEVHLDLDGYPVNLLDTAGIRDASDDPVEREGMRRARAAAARADLVLWIVDANNPASLTAVNDEPPVAGASRWIVVNKIDLIAEAAVQQLAAQFPRAMNSASSMHDAGVVHCVSAATGAGLEPLAAALAGFAETFFTAEPALITRQRQQAALTQVQHALSGAVQLAEEGAGEELVAEQLRHAATALGRLTGRIDVEDILDMIFREFCVGK
jgi:tRNA modification GTPase